MKVTIDISEWALQDMERLIVEATRGDDQVMPVVRERTWPLWIGEAKAHLQSILEQIEKSRK